MSGAKTQQQPVLALHGDWRKAVAVNSAALPWAASPAPGVERRLLERLGGEVARATSVVRYAPGSQFAQHSHGGGEELLVLEGTLADEQGTYPAGTYLRNPPGSAHAPGSREGCTLLVKLQQMHPDD
ncbi:MAG: cupin domain-containing protein, partial [Synechococcus sp.]|nr:cupin domain-containing protein [Synechococcus sp.]